MADEQHDDQKNRAERQDKAADPKSFTPSGINPGRPSELTNATNAQPTKVRT